MPSLSATVSRVTIKKGLAGQDDNLDLLQSFFKELKAVTVEPSPSDLDLLTFAICTHYFGVITLEPGTPQDEGDEDAEGEPEEDSFDAGYVASPPPPSVTSISSAAATAASCTIRESKHCISNPDRSDMHTVTPEEEKVLKWREAFLAQLEEDDGEDEDEHPLLWKGKMPESYNTQSIPEQRLNFPNQGNDLDDYINWPDDIDEDAGDLGAQGGAQDYREIDVYSRFDAAESNSVLDREILQPEQFSSPSVREIPEIPTDPNLEKLVYDEAIKYRDILRAQRIQAYQEASASRPLFIQPRPSKSTPIGIIYLASSQTVDDPMHRGQFNIGLYVAPDYIGQQGLDHAVKEVVKEAFQDTSCHRVQAIIVDHKTKLHTLELYTSSGFSREGIGRREFFSPVTHEWKDVFYFAILDTDWALNNSNKTLWDDLLVCQQRERDELLRMEEKTLKRSNSIETIRGKTSSVASTPRSGTPSAVDSSRSAAATGPASSGTRNQSPKRRRLKVESDNTKTWRIRRSKALSTSSTSSSMGTVDTMSTISSEWELPSRQVFGTPPSNSSSLPIMTDTGASNSECWIMLNDFKKGI